MSLAVLAGKFIGAVLAECGPVLAEILSHAIREAFRDTVEDGARRDDLRERLLARVRLRNQNGADSARGTGAVAQDGKERADLGGGQAR